MRVAPVSAPLSSDDEGAPDPSHLGIGEAAQIAYGTFKMRLQIICFHWRIMDSGAKTIHANAPFYTGFKTLQGSKCQVGDRSVPPNTPTFFLFRLNLQF
jgi:hypothetical protein